MDVILEVLYPTALVQTEECPKQKQGIHPLGLSESRLKKPGLHLKVKENTKIHNLSFLFLHSYIKERL